MAYKKSGKTRTRLLEAAARIFAERGYYDTGIGDIAKEAKIGRASFYYYFKDKEKAARAVFDSNVERIYAAADRAVPTVSSKNDASANVESLILRIFVEYILLFEHIALNRATHAVYYDLVNFADYDKENIDRLKRTTYKLTRRLAAAYGRKMSEAGLVAFIVTTNAVAKSIFKALTNGILGFSLEDAADYFFRHAVLPDIPIPEASYQALLSKALAICAGIRWDTESSEDRST